MTRSIFDPDSGETERSGSTFRSEEAQNRSHLPRDVADGEVSDEERADAEAAADADAEERSSEERVVDIPKTDPDAEPRDQERP